MSSAQIHFYTRRIYPSTHLPPPVQRDSRTGNHLHHTLARALKEIVHHLQ